ncbi:MAG: ribonuclease H-like domain-containing protein [Clostridia bacterium]|nr:ribonuclease H-like domain-containing protein [Clostridia bacterium]
MRSLRERLAAVTSTKPSAAQAPPRPEPKEPFFCREHVVPLRELCGIERTTLDQVRACDPLFAGGSWDVRRLLFLDTETTGLSGGAGTLAFEIGVGFIDERGMVIRQYVMRDYDEEAAMLSEIARLFHRFDTVVSFNGKAFDLPLIESRMVMNRIRLRVTAYPHLDLLHAARRVYKLRLRRCNLASLEEAVLGQGRDDDLPGAQVPQRYFDYVKTREFALLEDVLRHNLQDVKSLAMLTGHLCAVFSRPQALTHAEDLYGVGRTLMRGGRTEQARACFKILGRSSLSPQAHMHLAASYKKEREWAEAVDAYQTMIARGEGGTWPYIELAKYYEHIARDIPRALRYANGALALSLNMMPLAGADEKETALIRRRIERLRRKQQNMSREEWQS